MSDGYMNVPIQVPPGGRVRVSDVLIGETRFNQTDVFDVTGKLVERINVPRRDRCSCVCCCEEES